MRKNIFFILFFSISSVLFSQLPNTDIWLVDVKENNEKIVLSTPVNITQRFGYDNQPVFSKDNLFLLYTTVREKEHAQLYKYDLISKSTSQQTYIEESIYSPTFLDDGQHYSVVMVELDDEQRLWKFAMYEDKPTLLFQEIDSVGYHCWINKLLLPIVCR